MDPTLSAPVRVSLDAPTKVANWRPLVHWILVLPHVFVLYFLNIAQSVCTFIAFFAILFTKRYPPGLHKFVVLAHRYQWRVSTYMFFMRETYPPFELDAANEDPGTDPAKLSIDYPEELSRFMPLVKWLLALPHVIVLALLAIGALFAWIGSFFAVLFTGNYPEGIRNYMVGLSRWLYRVSAYVYLLRDEYPSFSMQ